MTPLDLEYLRITVHSKDHTITIKNLYHPPNSQHFDTNMMEGLFNDNTIILGDFNAKNTTWGSTITNARGLELSNLVNDKAFLCLNDGTHTFRSSSYGSTDVLDLTFISPGLFPYSSWRVLDNIGSDHLPILVEIDLKVNCTGVKNLHWNFKKADDSDKHFARVTRNQVKSCRNRPADNLLFNVDFTLPELSYALQNLDTNKSPGPDSIPGHFLSHLGILGWERLLYICNLSWKTGKLPRQWKSAIVIPIHKPNKNASLTTSYHPISLTCITCKLMECMVLQRLTHHLHTNNLMPSE
ncbi:RNA-directed DNA polymerase from mobile element jockey [Trichonephila clavipes]|nr:RNA-directed DNA polymerase from mobile element jockey [Trichonephila clavipes]